MVHRKKFIDSISLSLIPLYGMSVQVPSRVPESWIKRVYTENPELLRKVLGVLIVEIGFARDHIHMVMAIPPRYSISKVMGRLKSQSASALKKMFAWLKKEFT